jgi:hypothetical protein
VQAFFGNVEEEAYALGLAAKTRVIAASITAYTLVGPSQKSPSPCARDRGLLLLLHTSCLRRGRG